MQTKCYVGRKGWARFKAFSGSYAKPKRTRPAIRIARVARKALSSPALAAALPSGYLKANWLDIFDLVFIQILAKRPPGPP